MRRVRKINWGAQQTAIVFAIATTIGLMVGAVTPPQARSVSDWTPSAEVNEAFASLQTSSFGGGLVLRQQIQDCGDFDFAFLHSKCIPIRRKHTLSRSRVATIVAQRPAESRIAMVTKRATGRVADDPKKPQSNLANWRPQPSKSIMAPK